MWIKYATLIFLVSLFFSLMIWVGCDDHTLVEFYVILFKEFVNMSKNVLSRLY
jgi:hypothetical protein